MLLVTFTLHVPWVLTWPFTSVSLYIAWRSVRHCVAVLPSWWKDSSDAWAPCSTLRTGLWPLLILQSTYCSTWPHLHRTLYANTITHRHKAHRQKPTGMFICKISFAGLAVGSLWRCTWLRLPATQKQSQGSCSINSPALTSRWALPVLGCPFSEIHYMLFK